MEIYGIPAYYDLSIAENRLMIEWVIKAEREKDGVQKVGDQDIRYILANLLHRDGLAKGYDRVIIDAPPRLTAACIQAFCAATHLLIPTVLDGLSGEAVGSFVNDIDALRKAGVCENLVIIGVVPYAPMTARAFKEQAREQLSDALVGTNVDLLQEDFEIPSLPLVSECAGSRIAYASQGSNDKVRRVRNVFDTLGAEIARRID